MPSTNWNWFLVIWISCLAGCAGYSERTSEIIDGPPNPPLLAKNIADAVPRPDPILAQGNLSPYKVNGVTYEVLELYENYSEEGLASWYGMKFQGNKTANGEIFDVALSTAAHRNLPIPCYVRVANLENGRHVIVRVNDRGPFHPNRIIDLSYGAATKLGFVEKGVAKVKISVVKVLGVDDRRPNIDGQHRYLQLGAFRSESAANLLRQKVQMISDVPVFVSPVELAEMILYRVRVGPLSGSSEVLEQKKFLASKGFGQGQPLP